MQTTTMNTQADNGGEVMYPQKQGKERFQYIYLHSNGEYEGFFAWGDTIEQAKENCLNRIKEKLNMVGKPFNSQRLFETDILRNMSSLDTLLINDDFIFSRRGEKH